MANNIIITANWADGTLSNGMLSRQYDNNRYVVQFTNYPLGEDEDLSLYLIVWMKTEENGQSVEQAPIELDSDQWIITNYYTQFVQSMQFQLCVKNEDGTFEAHSPIFSGNVTKSLSHDGSTQEIYVNPLFDPYREYVDELVVGAGAVVIDPDLDTAGAAADAKATGDAITDLNGRLTQVEQGGAGIPSEVRQAIYTLLTKGLYSDTGLTDEKAVLQSWATEVTDITISQSAISISGAGTSQLTATTSPAGGLITWSSSNPSVATVSSNGLVTGVSNGTATITASCGGKKATCTATVTGFAVLTGITATYTQSGTVYDTDSISNLKSDLVVVASYDNSTTRTLSASEYTLSGTLSAGTSTITVSYGGQTATFNVTVTHIDLPLYNWDLTASLTDTVENVTATTTATYTQGTGVVFDLTSRYCSFGQVYGRDRTYEIDVASIGSPKSTAHRRLLVFDSDLYTVVGGAGLTYRKGYGWYLYTGAAWDTKLTGTDGETLFNGKTVKLYLDADGMATVYYKTIGADDSTYIKLGESTAALDDFTDGLVVTGGNTSGPDSIAEATISGFRVYEGEK